MYEALNANVVSWIPEAWHPFLLVLKGVLAMSSVVLLLYHMNTDWHRLHSKAQRLRYLTLLAYAILVSGATAEQLAEGILLSYRHLGSIIVTGLLTYASIVSIRESRTISGKS